MCMCGKTRRNKTKNEWMMKACVQINTKMTNMKTNIELPWSYIENEL